MAIKCSAETTVTNQIDATDLIMWYYATTLTTKPLSPSTTSASATPTGWSLIEPTITSASDLSKYIYECLQIVWGDGTCSWGDVQLSASFEAAKQAYNLAHSTASIFTTFEQTHNKTLVDTVNESSSAITTLTESHQYGGINLLSNTKSIDSSSAPYTNSNISLYSNQAPIDGESFYYCSGPKYFQINFPTLINNQKYTLSFDISRSSDSRPVFVKIDGTETNVGTATATTWTRLSYTFTASASTTNAQIRVAFDSTSSTATYIAAIRHIKLEQGSLATPWEYSSNDISTLSNTVNTVSQTADSNSSTISNLTQTLGTNANGTTKTDDIVHQVSDISQDLNGITTRVGKTEIALKGNYAVSSTAKGTANKQATISPALTNYELVQGAAITVKFTTENTAANPTLNINSTGAKPIKTYSGAALSENEYKWDAGSTMTFVYDGTNWCIQDSTELTRIKNNETLINQTANNVLIKATESDTTAAQGGQHLIQSLINVAPNGIKINADKVDIEGAAIFSENGYLSQDNINAINNESQTIYIQAISGTSSVSGTTTWVTNTGESVTQDAANLTPVWTIKRPIYRTNYPVLFVATQYKTVDGTVTCTTPLKDDTITVIDAGHITTGTIDASNITVTNLNADNITTGTINGQRIGVGSLSLDKLAEDVYTETEVNNIVDNLQTQIDGAIETWTGTNIPTLNNTPASAWTTDSIKDTHVGDVYFVVNDQSQQNGYNYRFTKTTSNGTSTYSWQLIKDNDVTNALQRLTTAEGKIGTIETFDTTVSSFMTNTDNELSSIKTAATTLEGRVDTAEGTLATKVDTTTFNTLSQTVEGNSSSIQQLTTETTTLTSRVDGIDADIKVFNKQKETIITDTNVRSESPIDLTVFGFSRQITTTGKNLLDYADASWGTFRTSSSSGGTVVASRGSSRQYFAVPLAAGQSVTWHRNGLAKFSGYLKLCTSYPPVVGDTISGGATITNNTNYTLTNNSGEDACGVLFISSKPTVATLEIMQAQLEYGSAFTSYEYCSGGIPSPSQAWPREIRVVDQLTLHFRSKNLIDISDMERGGTSGGVNSSSTTRIRLKESKKIPVIPGVEYGIGGTVTNGSCGCYIYWNDVRGYWSSNAGWLESGSIVECPEGVHNARILFRREDDTTVTLDDFSNLWFGPIVEYEDPIDSEVPIDLQGHELRSVYDIAEDRLIFEKQTGSTYSLSLVQETGVTTSATSDGLDVVVGQNALSTTGDLSDGATVIYCLPEPIVYDLGTITLPNLSSPNIYVYGETERYTYASSYGVEIPYLEMSYWAMSIRNLVTETIEKQITTSAKVNEVSDTVDEHTRRIGSLETTVETKADGSDVTTISNRLNTVSDTVDGHTQSITSLNNTVATKADSSTVSALQTQTNTISDTVDGHTQSIGSLNSTIATKADGSTVTALSSQVNNISDTVDGHTSSISSLNTTVATKADSSTVTTLSNDYATFKQQVTGFESTVGETYATKTEVSDLSDELDSRTSTLGYSVIISSDVTDLTVANPSATLTAKVYKDGEELTSADIALIGSVKWYRGSTLVGTGLTLSANQKARYIARLEATINE